MIWYHSCIHNPRQTLNCSIQSLIKDSTSDKVPIRHKQQGFKAWGLLWPNKETLHLSRYYIHASVHVHTCGIKIHNVHGNPDVFDVLTLDYSWIDPLQRISHGLVTTKVQALFVGWTLKFFHREWIVEAHDQNTASSSSRWMRSVCLGWMEDSARMQWLQCLRRLAS